MYLICLILSFIIFLIIFVIVNNNNNNNNVELDNKIKTEIIKLTNVNNEKDYELFNNYGSYRLGDGFYLTNIKDKWKPDNNNLVYKNNIPLEELSETYSNSILSEYLKLSNYTEKDWDTLIEIINNKFYRDININKSTDCLMHVRVGDVIDELCNDKNFLNKFYKNEVKNQEKDKSKIIRCNYIKPLKYFQQKIKKLIKMGITKVYLMAGSHIKLPSYKYSTYYINKIMEEIEKAGLQVELKLGGSPDDDLLFSMNFDYFIPSEGQYCKLIKELNQKINTNFTIL